MYVPAANRFDDDAGLRALVATVGAGELVTTGEDRYPAATLLPLVWTGSTVSMHLARANPHWRAIAAGGADGQPALVVVRGAQAYVTPSWYAAKREHGRVVPTWNYSAVHLTGRARVIEDAGWLRDHVAALTRLHEERRPEPWAVDDAPAAYVAGQLRGIVGVEVAVERVEGKAKLSQNRSQADRDGVVAGLRADGDPEGRVMAEQVDAGRPARTPPGSTAAP